MPLLYVIYPHRFLIEWVDAKKGTINLFYDLTVIFGFKSILNKFYASDLLCACELRVYDTIDFRTWRMKFF